MCGCNVETESVLIADREKGRERIYLELINGTGIFLSLQIENLISQNKFLSIS